MRLIRLTPPSVPAISFQEVLAHLNVLDESTSPASSLALDPTYIASLIATAEAFLDGWQGALGRCLLTQEWELRLDCSFPECPIVLPLPPCQSVDSIKYIDGNGAQQTLAAEDFAVYGLGGVGKVEIVPVWGKSWPSTRAVPEAARVRFTAGYGDTPEDVPAPIRHAAGMLVAHLYENREAVTFGVNARDLPLGLAELLSAHRAV